MRTIYQCVSYVVGFASFRIGICANVLGTDRILKEKCYFPLWFCYKLCLEIKSVISTFKPSWIPFLPTALTQIIRILSNQFIYEFIIIIIIIIIIMTDKQYFPVLYSLLLFPWTHILFALIYEVNILPNLRLSKSFYQCTIFIFILILHPSEEGKV